jgi:predicted ATPase
VAVGSGPDATFLGRADELALLAAAVDHARQGSPSIVLIGGDAGIGKTSLTKEAADRTGVCLVVGRCVRVGSQGLPLAPVADLVRQIGLSHNKGILDDPRYESLARTARAMVAPAPTDGELFVAMLDLMGALGADEAVIVAFEDLHWADPAAWDLFEFLARNLAEEPVVLIGTYREEEVARDARLRRRIAELARLPGAQRVRLQGLSVAEVATRVEAILGSVPPVALVDDIVDRGEGNPLFTEELVAAHLSGEALPALLSDLFTADVEACGPSARAVVDALAVIGRETTHAVLASTVGLPEGPLRHPEAKWRLARLLS